MQPLDIRPARGDGTSSVDHRGRLVGPDMDAGAKRQGDRVLPAPPEERARRAIVGNLLGYPDVRDDRETEPHEVCRLVCERAERRESAPGGA
jgi:hypothetical protein